MNLLIEPWMPVRLRDGTRQWVAPTELSRPDVVAFDADRADFNGALAQFAIGLLQTTTPIDNAIAWRRAWASPPHPEELAEWFAPAHAAFDHEGAEASFMEDIELRQSDCEALGIGSLLIEAPGENALKNNTDHFVKRRRIQQMCPHCAVTALFTLQINAPAGGVGYRTGLRGGGPLTTLVVSSADDSAQNSLWHSLWLNVMDRPYFQAAGGCEASLSAARFSFPWMACQTDLQAEGGKVAPLQTHPAHVFWAMPRRVRLLRTVGDEARCDLCSRPTSKFVRQYVTRNQGLNYKGPWRHPLSPYYKAGDEFLPLHPQPGGMSYRHWLAWALGMNREKRNVETASAITYFMSTGIERRHGLQLRLWAFGYDMDNMKARCWYESTMPLFDLPDCDEPARTALGDDVSGWVDSADLAAKYLRDAVKAGWFSKDARGDFSFIDASFWSATEAPFYAHLQARIQTAKAGLSPDRIDASERWLKTLQTAARKLFDGELVGAGAIERQNPARITAAHEQLGKNLYGPKLRQLLGLPIKEKPGAKRAVRNPRKPIIT